MPSYAPSMILTILKGLKCDIVDFKRYIPYHVGCISCRRWLNRKLSSRIIIILIIINTRKKFCLIVILLKPQYLK